MAEFLSMAARTGEFTENFNCPPHNNHMTVTATFTNPTPGVGFSFVVEQRNQGQWSVFGGATVDENNGGDVATVMAIPNKDGSPRTSLVWSFTEQIVDDPGNGETTGTINRGGKVFSQYAMSPVQRITFDSYTLVNDVRVPAELAYAFDIVVDVVELTESMLPLTVEPGNGGGQGGGNGGQGGNGNGRP